MAVFNKKKLFSDVIAFVRRGVDRLTIEERHIRLLGNKLPVYNAESQPNITTAGNVTITAGQVQNGIITRDPNGGNRTDTIAAASSIVSLLGLKAGNVFVCYLINTADGDEAITLGGGTGTTIVNVGQTIARNEAAMLILRCTNHITPAISVYIVGA